MSVSGVSHSRPSILAQLGAVAEKWPTLSQAPAIESYEKARRVYANTPKAENRARLIEAIAKLKQKGLGLSACPKDIDEDVANFMQPKIKVSQAPKAAAPPVQAPSPPKKTFPNIREVYGDVVKPPKPGDYRSYAVQNYERAREVCKNDDNPETREEVELAIISLLYYPIFVRPCPQHVMERFDAIYYREPDGEDYL